MVGRREGKLLAITEIFFAYLEILNLIQLGQKPGANLRVLSASTGRSSSCAKTRASEEPQVKQDTVVLHILRISPGPNSLKVIDFC